jgi:hypothetical protein
MQIWPLLSLHNDIWVKKKSAQIGPMPDRIKQFLNKFFLFEFRNTLCSNWPFIYLCIGNKLLIEKHMWFVIEYNIIAHFHPFNNITNTLNLNYLTYQT